MKLTDRTELTGEGLSTDELHIVRGGVSHRVRLALLMNTSHNVFWRSTENVERIVFRKSPTEHVINDVLYEGDFIIFIDKAEELMIFGMAIDVVSIYPFHFSDKTKFLKFYEGNALL